MQLYQHSGRCGTWGVPAAAGAGVGAALAVGAVYAYATNWIPIIYLNFLLTIGFGIAVGAAVAWGARAGKIRNMPVTFMVVGVVGVLAVYFAWVFDPMARVNFVDRPIWDVQMLWEYMKVGYAQGFWGIGANGAPVTGWFLASVWVLEAAVIIGAVALTVRAVLGNRPFCEETNQWTTPEKGVARLSLIGDESADAKLGRLLEGDVDALGEFYRGTDADAAMLRLDLATCPDCPTCNFLTVKMVRAVVNKKGEVTKQEEPLLVNLQVATEDVEKVRSAGVDRPAEPPEAASEAAES